MHTRLCTPLMIVWTLLIFWMRNPIDTLSAHPSWKIECTPLLKMLNAHPSWNVWMLTPLEIFNAHPFWIFWIHSLIHMLNAHPYWYFECTLLLASWLWLHTPIGDRNTMRIVVRNWKKRHTSKLKKVQKLCRWIKGKKIEIGKMDPKLVEMSCSEMSSEKPWSHWKKVMKFTKK